MPTYHAYCSACDAEVDVRIGPGGPGRIELRDLACPHDELCGEEHCVLARPGGPPLREMLEFLPSEGGVERSRSGSGGLEEAGRRVEETRRASLAREMRRFREWWEGAS